MSDKGWKERSEQFDQFVAKVRSRMEQGHKEYGDGSFGKHPEKLLEEISEELEDVMGWSFILWARLQSISDAIKKAESG